MLPRCEMRTETTRLVATANSRMYDSTPTTTASAMRVVVRSGRNVTFLPPFMNQVTQSNPWFAPGPSGPPWKLHLLPLRLWRAHVCQIGEVSRVVSLREGPYDFIQLRRQRRKHKHKRVSNDGRHQEVCREYRRRPLGTARLHDHHKRP